MDIGRLLTARSYPFGKSDIKRVIVGVATLNDTTFTPHIKIINRASGRGVSFDRASWATFQMNFDVFSMFYDKEYDILQDLIIGSLTIQAQYADIRQVIIIPKPTTTFNNEPIVLDQSTFLELVQLMSCIETYFVHVKDIASMMGNLNRQIVDHICRMYREDFAFDRDHAFLRAYVRDFRLNTMETIIRATPTSQSHGLTRNIYHELLTFHADALVRQIRKSV